MRERPPGRLSRAAGQPGGGRLPEGRRAEPRGDVGHGGGDPPPLQQRYLLLTFVPHFVDDEGRLWLERLWHRDFCEHLRYLKNLTLCSPRWPLSEATEPLLPVEPAEGEAQASTIALPPMRSMEEALRGLPQTARTVWRAIGDSDVVHSGVAGWPYPLGWLANPIALARRRPLVLVVESAPWRLTEADVSAKRWLRAELTEALARFFVRRARVAIFTQPEYLRSLDGGSPAEARGRGRHVLAATWINHEDIVSRQRAERVWEGKLEEPPRLLLASRLVAEKGIRVLLDALESLERSGRRATVDVIGQGPLRGELERAADRLRHVRLGVLDPVPYGEPFFELLERYCAALVCNLGDEQPRVVFDAFARAVPVIASDTDGLRPHVRHASSGWLVRAGDPASLAEAIERATGHPGELRSMGLRALAEATRFTHRGMHRARWRILADAFGTR